MESGSFIGANIGVNVTGVTLAKVEAPVSRDKLDACVIEQNSRKNECMLFRLADGAELCDYASAGNEFSKKDQLSV